MVIVLYIHRVVFGFLHHRSYPHRVPTSLTEILSMTMSNYGFQFSFSSIIIPTILPYLEYLNFSLNKERFRSLYGESGLRLMKATLGGFLRNHVLV